jgi:hypothetical protein
MTQAGRWVVVLVEALVSCRRWGKREIGRQQSGLVPTYNTNSTAPANRPFRVPSRTYLGPLLSSTCFEVTRAADGNVLH